MFTGLIECMGTIVSVQNKGTSISLGIRPDIPDFSVVPGGSVAVDGACLTVEEIRGAVIYFAAVKETLDRTTLSSAVSGRRVNCERAMEVKGRFDGHIVLGHVDRSEEHTSELQSRPHLVCRLLLEKKKNNKLGRTTI